MANKKNKKKASQRNAQAGAASAKVETTSATVKKSSDRKAGKEAESTSKSIAKAKAEMKAAKEKEKAKAKAKKADKPGFFGSIRDYFRSVRTEMRRVTWPSKKELINYSVVVCVSLVAVGIVIAVLDFVIGEGLFLVSGLRG